jgi:DNA-binding transcriptional LysR family regulator
LSTFIAVAEHGTVSKAAEVLRITQPALSRQIGDLQQELGFKLFERVGRRLVLTAEGEQLLGDFRALLGQVGALGERIELLRRGDSGVLKVGASSQVLESVFPTFLHRYGERYPNVQVRLIEVVGLKQLDMLEQGELHLAVNAIQADAGRFESHALPPIETLAAFHPSLELGNDGTIEIRRLASCPLLLPDQRFETRKRFDAASRLADIEHNVVMESSVPHTLLALAEAGHGVAIIPSTVQVHRHTLRIVRITHERKVLQAPMAVVWGRRRTLPRFVEGFCPLLAEHMRAIFPIAQPTNDGFAAAAMKLGALPRRMARRDRVSQAS